TFRLSAESIARAICFSEIAERDKLRPFACRIACFPEDCLSVINHAQKVSSYSILRYNLFTGHQ
ncbi:MAG: hypothetical protein ACTTIF_04655, partial [Prevotella sp.]